MLCSAIGIIFRSINAEQSEIHKIERKRHIQTYVNKELINKTRKEAIDILFEIHRSGRIGEIEVKKLNSAMGRFKFISI